MAWVDVANIDQFSIKGEFCSHDATVLKGIFGDYGFLLRHDGESLSMLFTDKGNPNGGWNSFRPFRIWDETGIVDIGDIAVLRVRDEKIGIHTYTPTEALHVEGNIYCSGKIIALKGVESASLTQLNENEIKAIKTLVAKNQQLMGGWNKTFNSNQLQQFKERRVAA